MLAIKHTTKLLNKIDKSKFRKRTTHEFVYVNTGNRKHNLIQTVAWWQGARPPIQGFWGAPKWGFRAHLSQETQENFKTKTFKQHFDFLRLFGGHKNQIWKAICLPCMILKIKFSSQRTTMVGTVGRGESRKSTPSGRHCSNPNF